MPWQVYVHSAAVHDLSLRLLCKGALPEGKCFARRVPQPPTLQIPIRKGITSSFQRPAREPLELSLLRFYCVMRWNAMECDCEELLLRPGHRLRSADWQPLLFRHLRGLPGASAMGIGSHRNGSAVESPGTSVGLSA